LVVNKQTRKKSNDTGAEKKTGNTKTWKNGEGKSIGYQRAECPGIIDRRR